MWKKVLAGALILTLLAGCGFRGFRDVYEDIFRPAEPVEAQAPQEQTTLFLPLNRNDSISPYAAQSDMNLSISGLIFDPLFRTDNRFESHPCLAESITSLGNEYIVILKSDAVFSDGTPVTAEDVVYSYQQTELQARRYWQLHTSIESVQALDGRTLLVKSYRADKNIAGLLSFPIVKQNAGSNALIGTGRYVYREEHGRQYLAANPRNSQASDKIREIDLVALPNDGTVANALRSGTIHCLYTDFAEIGDYGLGSNSFLMQSGNVVYVGYSSRHPLLSQRRFRQLMAEMVSRESVASDVYFNKASAAYSPFPDSYYDLPELEKSGQNDDIINMELEQLGLSRGENGARLYEEKPMELHILVNSENTFRVKVAETLVRYLSYYGIQAVVEPVAYDRYLARLSSGDFDLFIAEVCVGENVDISPLISGSSLGIAGDCSDAQLLEQYYAYCSGTISCAEFLQEFERYSTVTPLVYRHSGVVVSPSFTAVMTPVLRDIFYNIDKW